MDRQSGNIRYSSSFRDWVRRHRWILALSAIALLAGGAAWAGAFIFSGEFYGPDVILHPAGYTGTQSVLNVNVCINEDTPLPAGATIAQMVTSIKNNIAIWNQLQPITGNALQGSANDLAWNQIDFESVALHELGHCIGLAHVNAASESGLPSGPNQNYTKATDGSNGLDLNPGSDGVIGSFDEIRGDDVNLHWFRMDTNDPGQLPLPVPVDGTTYDRDQSSLPTGHTFAANLDRTVAGTLGHTNTSTVKTEAVMQQVSYYDEDQRRLTADGAASILLAASGLDLIAGTADDYVLNLIYGGVVPPDSCDTMVQFTGMGGLANCQIGAYIVNSTHFRISTEARTPVLDSLAGRGTRYSRALTASPLTLPAHASLLTGLDPPAHGLLDNGTAALPPAIPTLASTLSATGYSCAAFVSSRVLDRRFGLDRGFAVYDDFMAAEQTGEYGYPERDAAAVTSSAISWLGGLSSSRPYFLWVHYYDPHAPYSPPPEWEGESNRANYAGEIAYMDQEIGRLLSALPGQHPETLIAVVGDHGESLGEHGERTHGVFLYRAVLEVPLIVAGPGVPESEVIDEAVATRRLPATLLRLLGAVEAAQDLGPGLPGLTGPEAAPAPEPIYSATWMPANAYGWSPLRAVSDQRWRFILAPRPELYDYRADAGEEENRIGVHPREVERLKQLLAQFEEAPAISRADPSASSQDPQLLAALRSLGYLSGSAGSEQAGPALDPKDGLGLLAEFERAGQLLTENPEDSLAVLHRLVERNPDNIPFLGKLAQAELSAGNGEAALETYRRAVALNPGLDFQRRHAER